jgi:hypothetical protein
MEQLVSSIQDGVRNKDLFHRLDEQDGGQSATAR